MLYLQLFLELPPSFGSLWVGLTLSPACGTPGCGAGKWPTSLSEAIRNDFYSEDGWVLLVPHLLSPFQLWAVLTSSLQQPVWLAGLGEPAGTLTTVSAAFPSSLQSKGHSSKSFAWTFMGEELKAKTFTLCFGSTRKKVSSAGVTSLLVPTLLDAHSAVTGVDINAAENGRPLLPLLRDSRIAQFLLTLEDPESHLCTGVILCGSGKNTDNFLYGLTVITAEPAS